jgi:hypothetical protein
MHGSYFCVAEDGEKFDTDIPMFVLDALERQRREADIALSPRNGAIRHPARHG